MSQFLAVILLCPIAVSVHACDEANALDVLSVRVANEIGCATGWQEIVARSALSDELSENTYLKTVCHRLASNAPD